MTKSIPKFSVVIPCYNEELNIPYLVSRLDPLTLSYANLEIVLVNNGSTDNSESVMLSEIEKRDKSVFKYFKVEKNQGYGFGILSGLDYASGDFLGWTHADLQTDPSDLIKGIHLLINEGQKAIVKGKRYGRPLFDQFFTKMMEVYANITLNTSINDINAQPKIFDRYFYETYIKDKAPLDFSLDLYLLWIAQKSGYWIKEFPVTFENRIFGEAKGGGSIGLKWKLTKRTISFTQRLKKDHLLFAKKTN